MGRKNRAKSRPQKPKCEKVMMAVEYGGLQKGQEYRAIAEGFDWIQVKSKRGIFYVPKNFIGEPENLKQDEDDDSIPEYDPFD